MDLNQGNKNKAFEIKNKKNRPYLKDMIKETVKFAARLTLKKISC